MEIITDKTETLVVQAGEAISRVLEQYTDRPVLLLFSGGSALSIIEHVDVEQVTKRVTLGVLDERFGVPEDQSNFSQLEATDFYRRAIEQGAGAIDPRSIDGEGLEETAAWVETTMRAWFENTGGVTVITQGVGKDGHTAGILPFPDDQEQFDKLFVDTNRWVVGYEKPGAEFPKRITVTMPFLQSVVTSSVVYAVGEKKKNVLEQILDKTNNALLAQMPGQVIREMNDVLLLSDQHISG